MAQNIDQQSKEELKPNQLLEKLDLVDSELKNLKNSSVTQEKEYPRELLELRFAGKSIEAEEDYENVGFLSERSRSNQKEKETLEEDHEIVGFTSVRSRSNQKEKETLEEDHENVGFLSERSRSNQKEKKTLEEDHEIVGSTSVRSRSNQKEKETLEEDHENVGFLSERSRSNQKEKKTLEEDHEIVGSTSVRSRSNQKEKETLEEDHENVGFTSERSRSNQKEQQTLQTSGKRCMKFVILGDSGVGKTCLLHQFVSGTYTGQHKTTVGADVVEKRVTVGDQIIYLYIWDTAGMERFESLGRAFYRGANACILVFDSTNRNSFKSLDRWHSNFLIHALAHDPENFPFVLLGNKADLKQSVVTSEMVQRWCQTKNNIPFFEVSAKDGLNVDSAFLVLTKKALAANVPTEIFGLEPPIKVTDKVHHKKKKSCRC